MHINYEVKKSIRGAIGDELASLGAINPNIVVLDADLSGSTKTFFICIHRFSFPHMLRTIALHFHKTYHLP